MIRIVKKKEEKNNINLKKKQKNLKLTLKHQQNNNKLNKLMKVQLQIIKIYRSQQLRKQIKMKNKIKKLKKKKKFKIINNKFNNNNNKNNNNNYNNKVKRLINKNKVMMKKKMMMIIMMAMVKVPVLYSLMVQQFKSRNKKHFKQECSFFQKIYKIIHI